MLRFMLKNVLNWPIVLGALAFLLSSCEAFRPMQDSTARTEVRKPRKTTKATAEYGLRKNLVYHARKQKGVKYRYGGKSPRGFDCSGYTSYVYQQENLALSPSSQAQAVAGKKIRWRDTQPGDLLFFSKNGRGKVSHVAMVIKNTGEELVVIHSTSSKGVMEQDVLSSTYWKPKMLFARDVLTGLSGSLTRR